jgi:Yip1 domain
MNNFQVARLLVTGPTRAFSELKQTPVFALPMWLVLFGAAVTAAWYYHMVDLTWLQDESATALHLRPTRSVAATPGTRQTLMWLSTIGAPIYCLAAAALGALYLLLVGSLSNVRYSYRHWFAFAWWAATPVILQYLAAVLVLVLTTTTQLLQDSIQPLSLNQLLFHRGMDGAGYNLLSNFGLVQIAQAWLAYAGLRAWSARSVFFCLALSVLPLVLIFGTWALISFR